MGFRAKVKCENTTTSGVATTAHGIIQEIYFSHDMLDIVDGISDNLGYRFVSTCMYLFLHFHILCHYVYMHISLLTIYAI